MPLIIIYPTLPIIKFAMLYVFFLCLIVFSTNGCEPNCATCRDQFIGDYYCLACKTRYEIVTTYGICIQDTTIANCALYDQTLDCLACQPTFQQSVNLCSKMYDGCLLYEKETCTLCQKGSFYNPDTQSCTVGYLHCQQVAVNGSCTRCSSSYTLRNGNCQYNSSLCRNINFDSGLCSQCSQNALMVGFSCVPRSSNVSLNCYLAEEQSNITCKYCKMGYGAYFGECRLLKDIIEVVKFQNKECTNITYLNAKNVQCFANKTGRLYSQCLIIDFGFQNCLICKASYTLNEKNECIPILTKYCLRMAQTGLSCLQCKQNFYLKQGQCLPFPPFCLAYTDRCTKCQPSFILMNGHCTDPNCQTVNPITGYCQICFINYQLNPSGVCKYIDPNCKTTGSLGDCLECLKGYFLKNNGLCGLQDNNCLSFNNVTGICSLCRPEYYFNVQGQICIPLPQNCIAADIAGRCTQCTVSYTLTSVYQCLAIPSLQNCRIVNNSNYSLCTTCVDGFFADSSGACQQLPPFCMQIDPFSYTCTLCSPNGVMRGRTCVDKNCKIFDADGNCLACLSSFQFGRLGECIPETRDPNCQFYVFGICKSCYPRYYFDLQFNCVPVSAFCQTYDANSGACTSCYRGYQLINNGDCIIAPFNSILPTVDFLGDACISTNSLGQCIECNSNFNQIPAMLIPQDQDNSSKSVVSCVQKIQGNTYCLHFDSKTNRCRQCVFRMYIDNKGECKGVDQSCQNYTSNGTCTLCYPGFTIAFNDTAKCIISNPQDPNCQIKSNISGCIKCYKGYYYQRQTLICTKVNPQCATYNQSNGYCTSCYSGYELNATHCVVSNRTHISTDQPSSISQNNSTMIKSQTFTLNSQPGCLTIDFDLNVCIVCEWGYSLINGSCILRDRNCQTFTDSNSLTCLKCYSGYSISPNNQSKCVLSTLLLPNCLKYDQNTKCLLCNNGYVLTANLPGVDPSFICSLIDPKCLNFNLTINTCQLCKEGTVLQGRVCVQPLYGLDPNCILYAQRMCVRCQSGWVIVGFTCTQG